MGNFLKNFQASPDDKPSFDNRLTSFDVENASTGATGANRGTASGSQNPPTSGPNDVAGSNSSQTNQQGTGVKQQASGYNRELERIIKDVRDREIQRTTQPESTVFNQQNQESVQKTIKSTQQPQISDDCVNQLNKFKNVTGTAVTKKPNWVNNGVVCYPDFSGHNGYKDLSVCLTQFPTCYGNDCPAIENHRGTSKWDLTKCAVPIPSSQNETYETPPNNSRYANLSNTWNMQRNYNL
jgi:hypothetical protein